MGNERLVTGDDLRAGPPSVPPGQRKPARRMMDTSIRCGGNYRPDSTHRAPCACIMKHSLNGLRCSHAEKGPMGTHHFFLVVVQDDSAIIERGSFSVKITSLESQAMEEERKGKEKSPTQPARGYTTITFFLCVSVTIVCYVGVKRHLSKVAIRFGVYRAERPTTIKRKKILPFSNFYEV